MATPQDVIKGALIDLGVLDPLDSMTATQQERGRLRLNQMLESWNLDGLTVYANTRTTKTLTPGDGDYTIGAGGDINVTQPIEIPNAAIITTGTIETPLEILTDQRWAEISDKSLTGIPYALYLQRTPGVTNRGTVYPYYVPDAAHTLVLYLRTLFASIAAVDIGNAYYLLPGYELAIQSNLAVAMAPQYGVAVSAELALLANSSLAKVRSSNAEPATMACDAALMSWPSGYVNRSAFNNGGW